MKPAGMNLRPLANFMPKYTSSTATNASASHGGTATTLQMISGIAQITDAMMEALLPAFRKPMRPPTMSRTM